MMLNSIAVILLFGFLIGRCELIEIKTLEGHSGLYFEETGSIRFYRDEWQIVSNVNLTLYKNELDASRDNVELIRNCCQELKSLQMENNSSKKGSEGCGPILYQLNIVMADIEDNDNNLFAKDKRFKRNALSKFMSDNWSEDQSLIQDEFKKISEEGAQRSTKTILRTSFISSTLNSFGRNKTSDDDFVKNEFSSLLSTLSAIKNGSVNVVQLFRLRNTIQEVVSYQIRILLSFLLKQKQYSSIMSLVGQRNPIIPNILPLNIFAAELSQIRNVISQDGLDLPMQITSENLLSFYHISSPEIQMLDYQIYVSFRIPLISKHSGSNFSLFKITSLLHSISGNLYSFIYPNHEFIAVDEHKEHYTTLTIQDFQNCYQANNLTSIICKQTAPIMSTLISDECEINLLQKDVLKSTCNVRFIKNNADIFIKILKPNSWLLTTLSKSKKASYMCDGKHTQDYLLQSGILTIESDCKLATDNLLITGHKSFPKSTIYEHPNLKVHSFDENIIDRILSDNLDPPMQTNNIPQVVMFGENEKLLRISYGMDGIKINSLVNKIRTHIPFMLSLLSANCFFVFIACMAIDICQKNKKLKSTKRSTKPSAPKLKEVGVTLNATSNV